VARTHSHEAAQAARSYFSTLELFEQDIVLSAPITARRSLNVLPGAADQLPKNLEEFNHAICRCTRCPLGHTRTKFVFGDGNPQARIVFVGEAPGREEDLQGIPFVGRAGQLLDQMLAEIGLDRRHVYICNVLKCRPPNNRDPEPVEVATCRPYLLTQLSLISPSILVCLGHHAAAALLGVNAPMRELRGRVLPWQNLQVLVTYHPAYYLRNNSQLYLGQQDFKTLRRLFDESAG
jgi:uracil-DNA glycosylase